MLVQNDVDLQWFGPRRFDPDDQRVDSVCPADDALADVDRVIQGCRNTASADKVGLAAANKTEHAIR